MADFSTGRIWAAYASPGYKFGKESLDNLRSLCDKWREKDIVATDQIGGWPGGFEHIDLVIARDEELDICRLINDKERNVFESAQRRANDLTQEKNPSDEPQVDSYLHMGGLSARACGVVLQIATNRVIFPPNGSSNQKELWNKYSIDYIAIHYGLNRSYLFWDADTVKTLNENADWDNAAKIVVKAQGKEAWKFINSAREFMNACVELKYGIRFTSST